VLLGVPWRTLLAHGGALGGVCSASLLLAGAGPASAAFPGANGKIAFSTGSDPESAGIYTVNVDGSGLSPRLADGANPSWSPDGSEIAFQTYQTRDHWTEISVMNADGGDERNITTNRPFHSFQPAWSPDGKRLAFTVSFGDYGGEIRVMNPDGSGVRKLGRPGGAYEPAWSPDGGRIVFLEAAAGNGEIYVMRADGSEQRKLTKNGSRNASPVWSPDGREIAYESNQDGDSEIY
jgi:TolB protein